MRFIYAKKDISYPIATAISEYKKYNKGAIHHNEIHRRVEQILGHSISDNKLLKALSDMVQENDLRKDDPKQGKRGSKVYYSLTHEGEEKFRLGILGPREEVRKKKALYQLLIYFEVYKRRPLLTKIQLSRFLRQIGSTMKDLEKDRVLGNISGILFKPIKGVDVIMIAKYDKRTKTDRMFYYIVLPGFSVGEFVSYLKLLKNKTEPRPFSTSHTFIPYIRYIHFSRKEINELISSFHNDGLIKTIKPIIRGEKRYAMTDDRLRNLSYYFWAIQIIDINLLIGRLIRKKPTKEDREYLSLYLGDKSADRVLTYAYGIRKQYKEGKHNDDNKDREATESLEQEREFLVKEMMERCESTIKENEVVREIMEGICW